MEQQAIEKGIKPTISGNDPDLSKDKIETKFFNLITEYNDYRISRFFELDCQGSRSSGNMGGNVELNFNTMDLEDAIIKTGNRGMYNIPIHVAFTELGMDSYLSDYVNGISNNYNKVFDTPGVVNTCYNLKTPMLTSDGLILSYRYESSYGADPGGSVKVKVDSIGTKTSDVKCPGHEQTAGESSVRPLLSLDLNKIAYSGTSKPTYITNATLNQTVPMYLTLQ